MIRFVLVLLVFVQNTIAFSTKKKATCMRLSNQEENGTKNNFWRKFDDAVDDFFNKRMGNGEIFYGKRKVNPSGKVEGDYNGFGMTDKLRIDQTRELKEIWLEQRQSKEDQQNK
jgi:hypothetical protein